MKCSERTRDRIGAQNVGSTAPVSAVLAPADSAIIVFQSKRLIRLNLSGITVTSKLTSSKRLGFSADAPCGGGLHSSGSVTKIKNSVSRRVHRYEIPAEDRRQNRSAKRWDNRRGLCVIGPADSAIIVFQSKRLITLKFCLEFQ